MTAPRERLEALTADRVLWGLDGDQERELEAYDAADVEAEFAEMERVAAAIASVIVSEQACEEPPLHVRARLEGAARALAAGFPATRAHPLRALGSTPGARPATNPAAPASVGLAWAGWVAAAALLVVTIWSRFGNDDGSLPLDQRFEQFVASQTDIVKLPWRQGPEGEVVWSPQAQTGFLVLRGLTINDPGRFQYQLWIFDRPRGDETPVDGGVFDVGSDGRAIVPIDAKILVHDAHLFAVTKEAPGGVVVSDRRDIVALAD